MCRQHAPPCYHGEIYFISTINRSFLPQRTFYGTGLLETGKALYNNYTISTHKMSLLIRSWFQLRNVILCPILTNHTLCGGLIPIWNSPIIRLPTSRIPFERYHLCPDKETLWRDPLPLLTRRACFFCFVFNLSSIFNCKRGQCSHAATWVSIQICPVLFRMWTK